MRYVDTGASLGPTTALHPVFGTKAPRPESPVAFALRHGWRIVNQDRDDFHHSVRLSKGERLLDLALYPNGDLFGAACNRIKVRGAIRARVESYIAGVECGCDPDSEPDLYAYEKNPVPSCPIHGEAR